MWNKEKIHKLVLSQRKYFLSGETLDVEFRIEQLKKLKNAIETHEKDITKALYKDLGRSDAEAYFCDIGSTILEINEYIKGLKRWARPELHFSGIVCFPSLFTKVYKIPYGVTLIISPFNFPFLLSFGVLAASIAGGNTAIIKASSKSAASTACMVKIIKETFDSKYVTVVDGGHDIADMCLEERVDKIFYTGSPKVAKHVMEMASKNLTPVALELGGETGNWAIIRKDADLVDTAKKIAFFKACNAGQICININQIAVEKSIADEFVQELIKAFRKQLGDDPILNPEYPKLITTGAYDSCENEAKLYEDRIVYGGYGNRNTQKYCPTIIYPVKNDEAIVQHELFCPLLPIVTYTEDKLNDLINIIETREHPLAMYLFTKDIAWADNLMSRMQYGGGCINEVCVHMMVKGAPFNGTGHSGMGSYHGIWGFREFTHPSTVLKGYTKLNLPLRVHPYSGKLNEYKIKLLKLFER